MVLDMGEGGGRGEREGGGEGRAKGLPRVISCETIMLNDIISLSIGSKDVSFNT